MENKNIKYIIDYLKKLAYSCVSDRLSKILSSVMICISLIFTISVCWQLSLNAPYVVPDMLFGVTFIISILLAVILFIFLFFKKYRPYAKVFFCILMLILYGAIEGGEYNFVEKEIPKNFVIDSTIFSDSSVLTYTSYLFKIKEFKGDYEHLMGTHLYLKDEYEKERYIQKLYTNISLNDFVVLPQNIKKYNGKPEVYTWFEPFVTDKNALKMVKGMMNDQDCYFGVNDTGNAMIIYDKKQQILFYLGV